MIDSLDYCLASRETGIITGLNELWLTHEKLVTKNVAG